MTFVELAQAIDDATAQLKTLSNAKTAAQADVELLRQHQARDLAVQQAEVGAATTAFNEGNATLQKLYREMQVRMGIHTGGSDVPEGPSTQELKDLFLAGARARK